MILCTASRSLAVLLATAHLSLSALAAEPIHLIVPTPPGSASDALGRAISTPWSQIGGRPVVIENVAGAGGTIGTARLVRSPNDGSTLAILSSNHSINPALYKKLPYDGLTDVTPIIMIGNIPSMLVASPGLEANTVAELIGLAQSGKKELVEGVVSGTSYQMASEIFKQHAGISTSRIPYKGPGEVLRDLMGGELDIGFVAAQAAAPLVAAGKLKGIAVTTKARIDLAPQVPTAAESGLPKFQIDIWLGVFGPAGMNAASIAARRKEIELALEKPEAKRAMQLQGVETIHMTQPEILPFLKRDLERNREIVQRMGMTIY